MDGCLCGAIDGYYGQGHKSQGRGNVYDGSFFQFYQVWDEQGSELHRGAEINLNFVVAVHQVKGPLGKVNLSLDSRVVYQDVQFGIIRDRPLVQPLAVISTDQIAHLILYLWEFILSQEQVLLSSPTNDDLVAFPQEHLRHRQANSGRSSCDQDCVASHFHRCLQKNYKS